MDLKDKHILITGASSGIGQAIAVMASQKGARLTLLARDLLALEATRLTLVKPEQHRSISLDLFELDFTTALESELQALGPFDGLVHAAGMSPTAPLKLLKHQDIARCFQLNVFSALCLSQLLLKPKYRNPKGFSAVYIASVVSEVGERGKIVYSMSKSALVGMSKSLALEYAAKGARFNCISPAVVETPLSQQSHYRKDPLALKAMLNKHPLGFGTPEDVAHAAVYLLSEASKWVTGTNMHVDGGYLAQ